MSEQEQEVRADIERQHGDLRQSMTVKGEPVEPADAEDYFMVLVSGPGVGPFKTAARDTVSEVQERIRRLTERAWAVESHESHESHDEVAKVREALRARIHAKRATLTKHGI